MKKDCYKIFQASLSGILENFVLYNNLKIESHDRRKRKND